MKKLSIVITLFGAVAMITACKTNANYKALLANEWSLEKIIYADSNYSVDAPANVYIIFEDSGKVAGRGGCNHFFGKFTVQGEDRIAMEQLASTRMFCHDDGFEAKFFDLLPKVATYKADVHELVLSGEDNKFTMHFLVRVEDEEVVEMIDQTVMEDGETDAAQVPDIEKTPESEPVQNTGATE